MVWDTTSQPPTPPPKRRSECSTNSFFGLGTSLFSCGPSPRLRMTPVADRAHRGVQGGVGGLRVGGTVLHHTITPLCSLYSCHIPSRFTRCANGPAMLPHRLTGLAWWARDALMRPFGIFTHPAQLIDQLSSEKWLCVFCFFKHQQKGQS